MAAAPPSARRWEGYGDRLGATSRRTPKAASVFRRTSTETSTAPSPATPVATEARTGGKGRPTPTRKEAEAAARARAKTPRTRKEMARAQRSARGESGQRIRQGIKNGEERYLPARDKGPVRRFIRDFVDSRFSFIELMLPMLLISMALGYSGNLRLVQIGNLVLMTTLMLIVVDMVFLRFRLRRELAHRFPGEPTKGTTLYGVMRSMQMKFMRLPKSQVRIGQKLPEHYR